LKFPPEVVDWAIAKLDQLRSMRKFPEDDRSLEMDARALLRIAHPVIVEKRLGLAKIVDGVNLGKGYGSYEVTPEDLTSAPEKLDAISVGLGFGVGKQVNPVDWLLEQAIDKWEFYPAPIKLRKLFVREFPPADGEFYEGEE